MSRMMLSARVLIENINCFSLTAMSVASVIATAVALRGAESISAISPKIFPGERVSSTRLPMRISTFPLLMMNNSWPASPCLKMTSPAFNSRSGPVSPAIIPKSKVVSAISGNRVFRRRYAVRRVRSPETSLLTSPTHSY